MHKVFYVPQAGCGVVPFKMEKLLTMRDLKLLELGDRAAPATIVCLHGGPGMDPHFSLAFLFEICRKDPPWGH